MNPPFATPSVSDEGPAAAPLTVMLSETEDICFKMLYFDM